MRSLRLHKKPLQKSTRTWNVEVVAEAIANVIQVDVIECEAEELADRMDRMNNILQ